MPNYEQVFFEVEITFSEVNSFVTNLVYFIGTTQEEWLLLLIVAVVNSEREREVDSNSSTNLINTTTSTSSVLVDHISYNSGINYYFLNVGKYILRLCHQCYNNKVRKSKW